MAATLSRRGPAPRARRSLLGLLAFVALGAAGCPNPASKFDEYLDRVPKRDMTIVDMALPPSKIFDVTGASLLSLSTVIEPTKPILFYTEAKLAPQQDGTGLLDLKLQPLHYMTHVVVGTPIEVKAVKVKDTGSFEAVLGSQTVVGDANPITGRDISATLTLRGVIRSKDCYGGDVTGMVTAPIMGDISGSQWAAVRVAPGSMGNALPPAKWVCDVSSPDAGAGEDGSMPMDASSGAD